MPVPDAAIVRLGVRQAEFGLIQKQKRWLLGLETTGFEALAAVMSALAVTARLGREDAALPAAARQGMLQAQAGCSMRFEQRSSPGRCAVRSMRWLSWWQRVQHANGRRQNIDSFLIVFEKHRMAP